MEDRHWTVTELWKYPIKSCKGTQVSEARIGVHGIEDDRRLMVVDAETGMFVAQRSDGKLGIAIKSMCLIAPTIMKNGSIKLSAPGMHDAIVSPKRLEYLNSVEVRTVQVWNWKGEALLVDKFIDECWFTKFLSRERPGQYALVMFPYGATRRAKIGYQQLRFADAYPFLMISQESLDDLNGRIDGPPLPMNRFRPNIVIKGGRPYDEDRLDRCVISGVEFEGRTLCVRCATTTTNQDTSESGKEPLATLATYRRSPVVGENGVVFGRNFNHLSTGTIKVGDRVDFVQY